MITPKPTTSDRRQARNAKLRADFSAMQKKHLRGDFIVESLCDKYFLAPSTVYAIVGEHGRYRQPSLSNVALA